MGPESQNCVNLEGTLDPSTNTITQYSARSEFGGIETGQVWIVNTTLPASYPISVVMRFGMMAMMAQ